GVLGSPLLKHALSMRSLAVALTSTATSADDTKKLLSAVEKSHGLFMKSENIPSDRNIMAQVIQKYYQEVEPTQRPSAFYDELGEKYGNLQNPETYTNFANKIFESTLLLNEAKWNAFIAKPDSATLLNDPAYKTVIAFYNNYLKTT